MQEPDWRASLLALCGLAALLLAGGCGGQSSHAQVAGQITQNGQPLEVGENAAIMLVFYELSGGQLGERSHAASVDDAGAYQVELPPGEYRVAVQLLDPYPQGADKLGGAYDQMSSPVTVDIAESREDLDIELSEA